MRVRQVLLATAVSAVAEAQSADRLLGLALRRDSAALAFVVRQRPAAARELVGTLVAQSAGLRPAAADSVLEVARRVASAYAAVWEDSFPLTNLARFARMTRAQRSAKVASDSIRLAGNAALGRGGVPAAMAVWREALRRSTQLADTPGIAAVTGNLGAGFYRASALDSAEHYLLQARHLAEAVGDRRTMANALGNLGSVAKDRGDLRRAEEAYEKAIKLRTRIGDVHGLSADHNNLGLIASTLGELGEARDHHLEAIRIAKDHQLEEAEATALLNLGNLASVAMEYEEASARYGGALAVYRRLESDADVALTLHNLALLELRRGHYVRARDLLTQALGLFRRVGTIEDLAQIRRDLAAVEAGMGNLSGAIGQLQQAEELLSRSPGSYHVAAAVALARADLAVRLNTYADADRHYVRAQSLYRRAGDASGESEVQQGRAMLLVERKQHARAMELLQSAIRTQIAAGDRRPAALTRVMLGHVQQRSGDIRAARRTLEAAVDTLRAAGDVVSEAAALAALGDLELENGAPIAAESHYRRGLHRVRGLSAETVSWQLHAGLGAALRARGALGEALLALRAAITEIERAAATLGPIERRSTFLADKWDPYEMLALLERERGDLDSAFAASERLRGRQILDLLSRGRVQPASSDSLMLAREQDLRRRITELTRELEAPRSGVRLRGRDLPDRPSGAVREALARAHTEYAQLLSELRDDGRIVPIVRADVASWRAVAAALEHDQAFVSYLVTDSTTVVFVVRPDAVRAMDLGVTRSAIVTLIDFARGTVSRARSATSGTAWRTPLRRLHQHLFAPIEDAGYLDGVRQLIIVPHAELHYLPFASLLRGDGRGSFLVERYDVGYAPSASAWLRVANRGSSLSDRVLAMAPRARDLPGSLEEVEAIRSIYGHRATVLVGSAASEDAFRASAPRYGIVHLATYGVLNQHNPLFSFVELSRGSNDGRLEVHEVFGLALNARLVVLSACQTGLASGAIADVPSGDDWLGLVQAFLGAGVATVIATLWAVEDRSTAGLMTQLHRRLRAGDSAVRALSQAQREALRNDATSSPFYWAGFVLVGR